MSEQYNTEISEHYAAYRPPIHSKILKQAISHCGDFEFQYGVDIGCGTGLSSKALSDFCTEVLGVEPSSEMLSQTEPSENISYIQSTGEHIPIEVHSSDIVTFAGSLSSAKSDALVTELVRVCRPDSIIVAYDFKVQLSEFMSLLQAEITAKPSSYNHAENFEGYHEFKELKVYQGDLALPMTSEQLAHVLFSSMKYYLALVGRFGEVDTFSSVVKALGENHIHQVKVDTYYSVYRVKVT
ncbi:class I SAM-dependent methyltransferase [Vibrio parahaemolyticus]|uniref:class I SAM-dependent methyltransferase n=1 Tax=Vibrio parahaemolyticus TaxID=670 RepID=UPI0029F43A8C|nr:class I SAM-dependent methyltransferase [Vibrio parahaemolyticus]MBE4377110.1 class I SAM-dependent methyltransferase [Vibrio parahaemolyticus]MEA5238891.1 class I SAM-dependent methyltransferase [Vibrio parahaemolyticus]HCG9724795.1 class I SAM-dependent methyltransferase [Vibrio parahaemolyticus]